MFSQAAAALAAALGHSPKKAEPSLRGRPISSEAFTYDLDSLQPSEAPQELPARPITLLKSSYREEHSLQVAVNADYICYGLVGGSIRVLNKHTAHRTLLKGHTAPITDMSFFSYDSNIIACGSKDGSIIVRGIESPEGDSGDPQEALYLRSQLPDPSGLPKVAWHPATAQILAAAASNKLCIFEVPSEAVKEGDPCLEAEPGLELPLPSPSASVTALTFSSNGQLLAAADTTGHIHIWHLEDDSDPTFPDRPRMSFVPFGPDNAPASLTCLYQAAATPADCVLLAGDSTNRTLSLWSISCPVGGSSPSYKCLQTITLNSSAGASDFFNHLAHQPLLHLIVLANSIRKQIYIFHYHTALDTATAACDYATCYSLQKPMLNFTTAVEAVESQAVPGTMIPGQLLLYAMQTDAVQQYYLDPATCKEPEEAAADAAGAGMPSPTPAAAASPAAGSAASSSAPAQPPRPAAAVVEESPAARAATQHDMPTPAAAAAAAASAPPPPVPTALMGSASPPGTPNLQPASPKAANSITAPPAAAAGAPSKAAAVNSVDKGSAGAAAEPVASKKAGPGAAASSSSISSSSATATAGPLPGMPPMPTSKLTKQASLQHEEKAMSRQASPSLPHPAAVEGEPAAPAAAAAAAGREEEAPVEPALAGTVIVAPAVAVPDISVEPSRVAGPSAAAGEAAAAAAAGGVEATPTAAGAGEAAAGSGAAAAVPLGGVVVSSAELAALRQQLGVLIGMQRELAAHQGELAAQLTAGTEQIRTEVSGVSSSVTKSLKSTEGSLGRQVDTLLKASAKKTEDERRKAATKERTEVEKIVVSALRESNVALVNELKQYGTESTQAAVRAMVTDLVPKVTQAVTGSVTASLQAILQTALAQELGAAAGPLAAAVERAVAPQLAGAVARPLQQGLQESFLNSLIPSFERATQVMFSQIEQAFATWMQDSTSALGGATASATSGLQQSVAALQGLAASMREEVLEGQKQVTQMASRSAAAGAGGGEGSGAQPLSVAQIEAKQVDPTTQVKSLLAAGNYEGAFYHALNSTSLDLLVTACRSVNPAVVLSNGTCQLSQGVLLSLMHQLASELSTETELKLDWLAEVVPCCNLGDPVTAPHMKGVLQGVIEALKQLVGSRATGDPVGRQAKLVLHLVNSVFHRC